MHTVHAGLSILLKPSFAAIASISGSEFPFSSFRVSNCNSHIHSTHKEKDAVSPKPDAATSPDPLDVASIEVGRGIGLRKRGLGQDLVAKSGVYSHLVAKSGVYSRLAGRGGELQISELAARIT